MYHRILPKPESSSRAMRFLFRLTITAAALGLLLWLLGPRSILEQYAAIDWRFLAIVAIILAAQFVVIVWRWKVIVDDLGDAPADFAMLARAWGASSLYGQFLPASVGGDLVRTAAIAQRVGARRTALSVVIDRISGLAVLIMMVGILTPFLLLRIGARDAVLPVALAMLAGLGMAIFVLRRYLSGSWWRAPDRGPVLGELLRTLFNPALALPVISLAVIIHVASALLVYVLGHSIDVPLRLLDCILLVPPALFLAALPISLSGWGIREGALAGAFALVGVAPADMVSVSILFGLTGPATGLAYAILMPFLPDLPVAEAKNDPPA